MAFKAITANTPASEPAHILAEDDAAIYGGIIGGDCVLDVGNKLKATVITNNSVRVSDGVVFVGGHAGRIKKGDYEDMVITNGVSGQKRYDLIVARFMTTGPGGTDTFKIVVVKGASGAAATDPAVVKGDLYAGDKQRDYPLWRVCLDGLSIVKVEQMYETVPNIKTLNSDLPIPVGGIFFTIKKYNISPAEEFPGTIWERIKGRSIFGVDENDADFNEAKKMGGEKKHVLSIAEMPSHQHRLAWDREGAVGSGNGILLRHEIGQYGYSSLAAGGGAAHNNVPPYYAAYIWLRIS